MVDWGKTVWVGPWACGWPVGWGPAGWLKVLEWDSVGAGLWTGPMERREAAK